jgi:hypothetical protein
MMPISTAPSKGSWMRYGSTKAKFAAPDHACLFMKLLRMIFTIVSKPAWTSYESATR